MKNFYLLLFYLLPLVAIAQNAYLPLPTENAEWTVLHEQISSFEPKFLHNYHYVPDGDTLINDTVYTRLLRSDGKAFERETASYVGAYRNEGSQVLFVAKDSGDAVVLYDFEIQPGWILSMVDADTSYYFQLENIDTIILNDQIPRRRYNFYFKSKFDEEPSYYHHSWIEGMGSMVGFFPDPAVFYMQLLPVDPIFSHTLLCYKENGQLLYTDSIYYKGECYRNLVEEMNPYQSMAVEGAHWIVGVQSTEVLWETGKYSFTVRGDTIVQGKNYKKIYQEFFEFKEDTKTFTNKIIGSTLYALMRDDILNRKVYCIYIDPTEEETRPCPSGEEFLLFDFSVEEGDTLNWCSLSRLRFDPATKSIADSIRYLKEDFTRISRKTIYTVFAFVPYGDVAEVTVPIIEGIGYGVIGPFIGGSYLLSYCVGTDAQCGILSAAKNLTLQSYIKIYPNPANDYLLLEKQNHPFESGQTIRFLDAYGRLLLQQSYTEAIQQKLDISNLPSGIFLLEIVDRAGLVRYREQVVKVVK